MKEYINKKLNIKRLLTLGDLDIRGVAAQNEAITAHEYFSKVEQFLESASRLKEILENVDEQLKININAVNLVLDDKMIEDLENMKGLLKEIGYNKLSFDIDVILNAKKSNNLQLTKKVAEKAIPTFNTLFDRIKSTHTVSTKRFSSVKIAESESNELNNEILLREALEYLDYKEAHRKLRILAVDDVSVVLHTLTSVLSPYYEVFALKSSSQVEKFLENTTPELFLLDIEMNEVNGFDLVPLIRGFEKHKDTPIIFLTGNASYSNLKGAISLGACDFIAKPIDKDILLEKIEKNIVWKKAY